MRRLAISLAAAVALAAPLAPVAHAADEDAVVRIIAACEKHVWPQFDCGCIAKAFVASGQEESEQALSAFFEKHTRTGETTCVPRERVLAGEKAFCERNFKMAFESLDCGCFAEHVLAAWQKYPYQRTKYLRDLRTDAAVNCQ